MGEKLDKAGVLFGGKMLNALLTAAMPAWMAAKAMANLPAMPPTASLVLLTSCLISESAALSSEASPENVNVTSAMFGQVFESVVESDSFAGFFLGCVAPVGVCSLANPSGVSILQCTPKRHPQDVFFAPPRRSCNCENQRCYERGVCAFGEVGESGSGIGSALAL